jgi:hypothetical protein
MIEDLTDEGISVKKILFEHASWLFAEKRFEISKLIFYFIMRM